jgi:2-polyprenyl-3-methyl-5-hydroxy-6-metoxy-1,4-benzoquinol methylase
MNSKKVICIEESNGGCRVLIQDSGIPNEEFVTSLPLRLVEEISKSWGEEAFKRIEDPLSYMGLEEMLRRRDISLNGLRVLDVGCRFGTSTLAISRMGANLVVGIDIDRSEITLAKRILDELFHRTDLRGDGNISYVLVPQSGQLPFGQDRFDVVICNALFEHIEPRLRPAVVRELWSLIIPGGYLIVHETPNRWWPRDGHTTGLWLLPLLPRLLAQLMALICCKRFSKEQVLDWKFMISQGIRGVTYKEIADNAPGHDATLDGETDDIKGHFDLSLQIWNSYRNRIANHVYRSIVRVMELIVCKPFKLPNTVVLPSIYMALKKV